MKLSEETLKILKGITLINSGSSVSGGVFQAGNIIKTRRYKAKTPIMVAEIPDVFERDFAIYDLKKFLSCIEMLSEPELVFNDEAIIIKSGRSKFKIRYCNPNLIEDSSFFEKNIKMPEPIFSFDLSIEDFKVMKSASARLSTPEFAFISENSGVKFSTYNTKDSKTDRFDLDIGESDKEFKIIISLDCLNFLPCSYRVNLTREGIIQWKSEKIEYFITMNDKSKV